jgi:RNA-directed DNA polymerase
MNGRWKSDVSVVPEKPSNKEGTGPMEVYGEPYTGTKVETPDTAKGGPTGGPKGTLPTAERVEERGTTQGNSGQPDRFRTQSRRDLQQRLERVRSVAKRDKEVRFTALWHHVYDVDRLREAYLGLKRESAPGVDGVTWQAYGESLEANLQDLSGRLKRGAYRARPVRRVYIPKGDGRRRPIGVPVLEDKVVQRATTEVLEAVYESDFLGYSYGFRPGRSQHNALDAVTVGIQARKVSWVLDADIRGFFDAIDHAWLMRFIEHRIADERVLRHVKKWLKAGVLEDGKLLRAEEGTPQGGSVSPLLANIYLHYAFDLWVQHWRRHSARGEVIVVRYADDFVMGFQYRSDVLRFRADLEARLRQFHLELHPDKTRVIEFGRFAAENRQARGVGKPETFDFLGFTHFCGRTRNGGFTVWRRTVCRRLQVKLKELKVELHRRWHEPVPEVGAWLRSVLRGHYQYYGVPGNFRLLARFRWDLVRMWRRALMRRSQRSRFSWARLRILVQRWLPLPHIVHPHPARRLRVVT